MKTLVNIISKENPISAYLFVKEMYEAGDRLLFFSAKDTEDTMRHVIKSVSPFVKSSVVDTVVLEREGDKHFYERICRALRDSGYLKEGNCYYVNLAGGTRYMALAVQQTFRKYNAEYFYTDVVNNMIIHTLYDDSIDDNDDCFLSIRHRMKIGEYLSLYAIHHDADQPDIHLPIRSKEDARRIFDCFTLNQLSEDDYLAIDKLRNGYRNALSRQGHQQLYRLKRMDNISIEQIENPYDPEWIPIHNLNKFLRHVEFVPSTNGMLSKDEIDYLTGGWFEEYVYYLVQDLCHPDDAAISVRVWKDENHDNELDVVFTKGNKLYVIECKTGVDNKKMFNEIVYKACALKEALLGISCNSFIFSLKNDKEGLLKSTAKNMDVTFCDRDRMMRPDELRKLLSKRG